MPLNEKSNSHDRTSRLFRVVTMPYRHWMEKRQLAQQLAEMQHQIATDTNRELLQFHDEIWSHWHEAAQQVRQQIRQKETFDE